MPKPSKKSASGKPLPDTNDQQPAFRCAGPDDLRLVMSIIAEAAAWHKANGIDQWPSPPNAHWWRRRAGHIELGEVYLAFLDGRAVGTLRLTWSDPYWPDDSSAGYIHQMAAGQRTTSPE